ncbi:MAG: helix-turn-helix domain-containing protein, partial [Rhodobacteraceae bacterium]|nr:helix-turn-helix domain-containing protein [Paracoccaceae bacterium]
MPLYSHLSSDERSEIAVFSAAGHSISVIARSLG